MLDKAALGTVLEEIHRLVYVCIHNFRSPPPKCFCGRHKTYAGIRTFSTGVHSQCKQEISTIAILTGSTEDGPLRTNDAFSVGERDDACEQ